MNSPGRNGRLTPKGLAGRILLACALAIGGLAVGVAPVIGDGLNSHPEPADPQVATTIPATQPQVAGAGVGDTAALISGNRKNTAKANRQKQWAIRQRAIRRRFRPVVMRPRITTQMITTEENEGTYVGVRCPAGSKAVSGGMLSQYINLLLSSSSPNHPMNGKFTPRIWWVTVTNADIDDQGGSLSWRGVVNCLTPVKLGKG